MNTPNFADFLHLAFRLGHMSASLGVHQGLNEALLLYWQDDINELNDRMEDALKLLCETSTRE